MADIIKQGQNNIITKLNLNYEGHKEGEEQVENYLKIVDEKNWFYSKCSSCICKIS